MARSGLLEDGGNLFSELGRTRKRNGSNSKPGRGICLLLVTVFFTLLLASRLLWCFMYLFNSTATVMYVDHHTVHPNRDSAAFAGENETKAMGEGTIVRELGRKANESEHDQILEDSEEKIVDDHVDEKEGSMVDTNVGNKRAEIEEVWKDEEQLGELMAKMTNMVVKLGDGKEEEEEDKEENDDSVEKVALDNGHAEKMKLPDAIAFLEQLAGKLTKTGVHEDYGPYHSRRIFESDYAEMKRKLRIFVYPHDRKDPFHMIFESGNKVPSGNYASEEFFQQSLLTSTFLTKTASEADFFFMPVSITKARMDKRINVGGLQSFCANYITDVRSQWSYWNRSNGADHFYLSCHSIARNAMDRVPDVRQNAIQLLCPASYFLPSYITHKDASVPQIWPRLGKEPEEVRTITQRKRLAFFAGALNSPVRKDLERTWANDSKILVHKGRVPYPYSEALLTTKFCLHAKGFEVNTARLGDAMYYGCVPVVIANYYDLPFQDILDWTKFSIVVSSLDIPLLKKTLEAVTDEQYAELHRQVLLARKHFQWHAPPEEYDAFHTVMYELWKRRHIVRRSTQ
ncbi:probable glycosyltransferase At5g11130 [Physcomitrium patens]|uniref:Exostosin GT47 domain-containing protein n=1 Tax=Physcomitrium patens TaxID=3218 RepID=A0A2K1IBM1_PHYPA|nr:probable glycosyltransferase At5g11130 [Physcomitrium patens]PNR26678.1 hypothetical protein PHYPA_030159 [Physcomitrium patens]|eukprot:XP_024366829.1 probable glycosyltransferase At5g11130 [Physcomitrella patens]